MYCNKCGTKNKDGAKFCSKCGEALSEDVELALENDSKSASEEDKLSKKDLLTYLKIGAELESNKLGLTNSLTELDNLDKKNHDEIIKPIEKSEKPTLKGERKGAGGGLKMFAVGLGYVLIRFIVIVEIIAMCIVHLVFHHKGGTFYDTFIYPLVWVFGIYAVIFAVCVIADSIYSHFKGGNNYKKNLKKYNDDNKKADEENRNQIALYNSKKEIVDSRISAVNKDLDDVEKTLKKYYDKDILYSKYRNLVAITTFIDYLESGRCKSLYGYTGCYNVYEQELRQNLIIGKLDQALDKLDQIRNTQYATYMAIQVSNTLQAAMLNTCNEMLVESKYQSAKLEAQNEDTKIIKRNSEINNTIATLNYIK